MKDWFEIDTGQLLTGSQAQKLDESEVLFLPEAITAPDFPPEGIDSNSYSPLDRAGWQPENYVQFGRWALRTVNDGVPREDWEPLTVQQVKRLAALGLAPTPKAISHRFTTFSEFKRRIGSPIAYERGRYDGWSLEDYINYAKKYTTGLPLSSLQYEELHRAGKGPGTSNIDAAVGGTRELNDYLGFPDTSRWEEPEYIEWGERVIRANLDTQLSIPLVTVLASRRRGPNVRTIQRRFGWRKFKDASINAHEVRQQYFRDRAAYDQVADELVPNIEASDYREIGRYIVAQDCLPSASPEHLLNIAQRTGSLVVEIRHKHQQITAGHIEMVAISKGVFDDIWPGKEDYREFLHVSAEEVDICRQALVAERRKRSQLQKERERQDVETPIA